MATAPPGGPGDPGEDFRNLCRFRELFSGRFTDQESAVILQSHEGMLAVAADFVLTSTSAEVRALLEEEERSWQTISRTIKTLRQSRPDVLTRASSGQITTGSKQFACGACDRMWWRRCPDRKEVSKCNRCKRRYDPLPINRMWGWAEFTCPHDNCGNEFGGFCQMGMSAPCFRCGKPVFPTRIKPPSERGPQLGPRLKHRCNGRGCGGRPGGQGAECVHPFTRRLLGLPLVVSCSSIHDSTGSTVDTFLSQTDLNKQREDFYPTLSCIEEDWQDEDDEDDDEDDDG